LANATEAQKLTGIEACRGVAAAMVVFYHAARHLDKVYRVPSLMPMVQFGHAGVDLFFVLSGFIILHVHYGDVGRPDRFSRYVERRLTRILPTYWVALAVTIFLGLAGEHAFPPVFDVAWSAALLPSHSEPILGIAWTLQFEMMFYAIFCLLILNRRIGLAALTLWLGWVAFAAFDGGISGAIPKSLYAAYNLEFFMGMGAAYWFKNHAVSAPRLLLFVGIALFALAAVAENLAYIDGYASVSRLIYGVPAVMIVLGMAAAEREGLIKVPGKFKTLGTASYSIYLFQFVFIAIAWRMWLAVGLDATMPHTASFPVLAAAGLIGGVFASRWVEYPLMGWIRHLRRPKIV
jgi:exopolysaccharide production protein ExoZ